MSVTCNFCAGACEGFTVKKFFCCTDDPKPNSAQGLVYVAAQGPQQFVLLNTPFIEVKEWIILDGVPFNTVTVFFQDTEHNIRALLHHEPHDVLHRISHPTSLFTDPSLIRTPHDVATGGGAEENKATPCEVHEGELVETLLPAHLRAPILRFMKDTLDGTWFQMHGMFNSVAKLIRTFPITDYNNRVVAGIMIVGPFSPHFDDQMQQYVLNQQGPADQTMNESADIELPPTHHLGRKKLKPRKGNTL